MGWTGEASEQSVAQGTQKVPTAGGTPLCMVDEDRYEKKGTQETRTARATPMPAGQAGFG